MFIVFDIDGVLANPGHRLQYILTEPKDWDAFFAEADADPVIAPMAILYQALVHMGYRIILNTGRSSQIRELTERWLDEEGFEYQALLMRDEGDHRPDHIVKVENLAQYMEQERISPHDIVFIVEDRASVVRAWRDAGFTCLQNVEGDF